VKRLIWIDSHQNWITIRPGFPKWCIKFQALHHE
jgi:hypothetical protein